VFGYRKLGMSRLNVQRVEQRERRAAKYVIHDLCDPAYVLFHAFCARLRRSPGFAVAAL